MCSTTALPTTFPAAPKQVNQTNPMNDTEFQQFFQSLATSSVTDQDLDSWLLPGDWLTSPEGSAQSSPEIATPADVFLTSPATNSKPTLGLEGGADLDVSAFLNTPLFDMSKPLSLSHPVEVPISAPVSTPVSAPLSVPVSTPTSPNPLAAAQVTDLFADLPAALAALAAAQSPSQPASPVVPANAEMLSMTSTLKRSRPVDQSPSGEPLDEVALKRQKNTDAARRSRLRKALKMEGLEKKVAELEKTNTNLLLRAAVLESEKAALVMKESSYEQRIKILEAQLAEAHKALATVTRRV